MYNTQSTSALSLASSNPSPPPVLRPPPLRNLNSNNKNNNVNSGNYQNFHTQTNRLQQQQENLTNQSNQRKSTTTIIGSSTSADLIMPDLSHLSEDERKIIEAVLERQRAEEEKDSSVLSFNNSSSNPSIAQQR